MTREQLIIECWERTGKHSAGASDLARIQEAIAAHFGADMVISPASIARTLADHGVQLEHPQILEADGRWREQQQPFKPEVLSLESLAFVERLARGEFENEQLESVRQTVRELKSELELMAKNGHKLAQEYVQWLTVWLQNPAIFPEWVELRRRKLATDQSSGTFEGS